MEAAAKAWASMHENPTPSLTPTRTRRIDGSRFVKCPICERHVTHHQAAAHVERCLEQEQQALTPPHTLTDISSRNAASPTEYQATCTNLLQSESPDQTYGSEHLPAPTTQVTNSSGKDRLQTCAAQGRAHPEDEPLSVDKKQKLVSGDIDQIFLNSLKRRRIREENVCVRQVGQVNRQISMDELCKQAPFSVVHDFLDPSIANTLLETLLQEAEQKPQNWKQHSWWIFGKKGLTPRLSAVYNLDHGERCMKELEGRGLNPDGDDIPLKEVLSSPAVLSLAADVVEEHVNTGKQSRPCPNEDPALRFKVLHNENESAKWRASYALCNLYRDGNDCVGAHADHLTSLGPFPIIASLSLGATRMFRVTRQSQDGAGTSFQFPLPHNTLLVMWASSQEMWRHEVPRTANVIPHKISNLRRLNITFRYLRPDYLIAAPLCHCRKRSILKTSTRPSPNFQRYYYACSTTTENAPCSFFEWARWCVPKSA